MAHKDPVEAVKLKATPSPEQIAKDKNGQVIPAMPPIEVFQAVATPAAASPAPSGDAPATPPPVATLRQWRVLSDKTLSWRGQMMTFKAGKILCEQQYGSQMIVTLATLGLHVEEIAPITR